MEPYEMTEGERIAQARWEYIEAYRNLMAKIWACKTHQEMLDLIPEIVAFDDDWLRDEFTEWWPNQWRELGDDPQPPNAWPPRKHKRGDPNDPRPLHPWEQEGY